MASQKRQEQRLEKKIFTKDSLNRWNDDAQRPEGLYLTLKN